MPELTFLNLPAEIRRAILHHCLPVRRLALRKLADPDFKLATTEGRDVPNLLYVSKQLYREASEIFYSRAILEIAPPPPLSFILSSLLSRLPQATENTIDRSSEIDDEFAFTSKRLLGAVATVHIFSDQRDAISAESYEATLKWLAMNTNVQEIRLSRRLMFRLRKSRVTLVDPCILVPLENRALRAIRVYSYGAPNAWEMTRRFEAQAVLHRQLKFMQLFCLFKNEDTLYLQAEPRLDVRSSDDPEYLARVQEVGNFLDRLAADVSIPAQERIGPNYDNLESWEGLGRAGAIPPKWLYQLIFVAPCDQANGEMIRALCCASDTCPVLNEYSDHIISSKYFTVNRHL